MFRALIEQLYCECWYHVESVFGIAKKLRRPFTYIFRDFLHRYVIPGWVIRICLITGSIYLARWNFILGALVGILYGLILGHLDWGGKYTPEQQEDPEYYE